jgi:ParB-like chromosome segregation protein Spo0J
VPPSLSLADLDLAKLPARARETLAKIDIDQPYEEQLETLAECFGADAGARLEQLAAEMRKLGGDETSLPDLTDEEYEALKRSIAEHGQVYPILVDQNGQVIDGRHRLRACIELGLRPKQQVATEKQKSLALVVNVARRHLTSGARRGIVRAELLRDAGRSDRQVAATVGVSHPTVAAVRRELEQSGDVEKLSTSTDTLGRKQPRDRAQQPPTERSVRVIVSAERFELLVGPWVKCRAFRLVERRPGVHELQVQLLDRTAASGDQLIAFADGAARLAAALDRSPEAVVDELLANAAEVFGREISTASQLFEEEAEWALARLEELLQTVSTPA